MPTMLAKAERQAFNTAIQASCADLFKIAAVRSQKYNIEDVTFKFGVFDSILLQGTNRNGVWLEL